MVNKTLTSISDEDVEKIEKASRIIETKEIPIPKVAIETETMLGENERKITISFKFNAHKIVSDDVDLIAKEVLKNAKIDVIKALEAAVVQEQKWLDATRN